MNSNETDVSGFFNNIAEGYRSKYSGSDVFLDYFFNERLEEAVDGLDLPGKRILDIGAGTGNLYDKIISIAGDSDYWACDIASRMLDESNIPDGRKFVGKCHEIEFPEIPFDIVFMLGVTTYLDQEELDETFSFIHSALSNGGIARITFTNEESIDWMLRRITKAVARRVIPGKYVLSQDFPIFPKSASGVAEMIKGRFEIDELRLLNHTVFPFYKFSKKASIHLAKSIHNSKKESAIKNRFSSDFMMCLRKI